MHDTLNDAPTRRTKIFDRKMPTSAKKSNQEHADILHYLQNQAHPYAILFIKQTILLKPQLAYLDDDDDDDDYDFD